MHLIEAFVFSFLVLVVKCLEVGDHCSFNGQNGTCILVTRCAFAEELLRNGRRPETCGFIGRLTIVCCIRKPFLVSYGVCRNYYRERRYYIAGGLLAKPKTYPHMALIGYGNATDIHWRCGGSLISETFILTAAHCIKSRLGEPKYVRLGELDILNTTEDAQHVDILIKKCIPHPEYESPSKYNDIALIEIEQKNFSNEYIKPACLHLNEHPPNTDLVATGWGKLSFTGETSSHLMEVRLNLVSNDECQKSYDTMSKKQLSRGLDRQTHVCAGGEGGKDTCQGDSGGPLQIRDNTFDSRPWTLVGVTSFGKACGFREVPGVYTKIYPYIPWIENIVWPDNIF